MEAAIRKATESTESTENCRVGTAHQNTPCPPCSPWLSASSLGLTPRQVRRLFARLLPRGQARRIGGQAFFSPQAEPVAELLADGRHSAEDLTSFSQQQIDEARKWVELLDAAAIHIEKKVRAGMNRTVAVEWFCSDKALEICGEPITATTFRRRVARLRAAGPHRVRSQIDSRGRPPTGGSSSPEAWDFFKSIYLDPRKRSARLAWELTSVESLKQGWAWSEYRTICNRVKRELPEPTRILFREGRKNYDAQCAPRIRRSYEDVPAGQVWCADEHTLDIYARAPDGKGGYKRIRPILTAWLDVRSRMFVGTWLAEHANSDTILAAFKQAVRSYGVPSEVISDNGADYKSAAGRAKLPLSQSAIRNPQSEIDAERLSGAFNQLDIQVHWCIPYRPQSKMIESHFRAVCERFSKLFPSYCGNRPENRPESVGHVAVMDLPTVEEVREQFTAWLKAHHDKPQTGDAMYNLSPAQAWQQFQPPSRRAAPSDVVLDFVCSRFTKPVCVTKDGVRWHGVHYGQGESSLYPLFGQQVVLSIQPDTAEWVWVCDANTRKPICRATNQRLDGTQQGDIREAERRRKRARNIARQFGTVQRDLSRSTVGAVIAAQASRNRAESAAAAPSPPEPAAAVRLVRPDLEQDLAMISAQVAAGVPAGREGEAPAEPRRTIDFGAINRALFSEPVAEDDFEEPPARLPSAESVFRRATEITETTEEEEDEDPDLSVSSVSSVARALPDAFSVLQRRSTCA